MRYCMFVIYDLQDIYIFIGASSDAFYLSNGRGCRNVTREHRAPLGLLSFATWVSVNIVLCNLTNFDPPNRVISVFYLRVLTREKTLTKSCIWWWTLGKNGFSLATEKFVRIMALMIGQK